MMIQPRMIHCHLLSLSKAKRSPAYSFSQHFDLAPLKVKEVGDKKGGQIERNNLNIPLGESNIMNATIPLLLSRSLRRRENKRSVERPMSNGAMLQVLQF